jgi:RNA polymerase sigma-70 factor (ECF subfamily)
VWNSHALRAAGAEARQERFETFARQHVDRSYRLAVAILRDPSEAEDATHDAFLRAWEHWPDLRDAERFDAWFGRILINECRNRLRQRRRSPVRPIVEAEGDSHRSPFDTVDDRDSLRNALSTLTPDHRVAIVLRFYLDLEVDEIARRTGTRPGTVKSRIHHGLRALAAAYAAGNRTSEARP